MRVLGMFKKEKERIRRLIARYRRSQIVRALHGVAAFVEDAYENEEWDMAASGEAALLDRLAPAQFRIALDVGAHLGGWSLEALRVWPSVRVHAFEVAPPTFERFARRVTDSSLSDRVTLNCLGLSDRAQVGEMYFYPEHPHLTCDRPRHTTHRATPFQAQLQAGDMYLAEHRIDRVDFVKIDVEGNEHLVLQGFDKAIQEDRLECIQFEYGAFSIDTRVLLADYYAALAGKYWIGKIYPTHVEFSDYEWTMESFRFSNFLCVAKRRPDLRALALGS
jgi:FkbM family methyltransferase